MGKCYIFTKKEFLEQMEKLIEEQDAAIHKAYVLLKVVVYENRTEEKNKEALHNAKNILSVLNTKMNERNEVQKALDGNDENW